MKSGKKENGEKGKLENLKMDKNRYSHYHGGKIKKKIKVETNILIVKVMILIMMMLVMEMTMIMLVVNDH